MLINSNHTIHYFNTLLIVYKIPTQGWWLPIKSLHHVELMNTYRALIQNTPSIKLLTIQTNQTRLTCMTIIEENAWPCQGSPWHKHHTFYTHGYRPWYKLPHRTRQTMPHRSTRGCKRKKNYDESVVRSLFAEDEDTQRRLSCLLTYLQLSSQQQPWYW